MGQDMSTASSTGLTLVLGPANSGKMGYVLEWWRDRLAAKPVVVAPTVPDARELTVEMALRTGGLVGQSPAFTFDGLARLLLPEALPHLTDLERNLLVSGLLRDTPLDALRHAVHLPGVATALALLLRQFGESGKRPEELDRILGWWAADADSAPLAGDVRRLAAAYARACEKRGVVDRPAVVRLATEAAGGWTRPVAFYGFTSFTLGQRELVQELARQVEVLVTFTHESDRPVSLCTPAEIAWWTSCAGRVVEVSPATLAYDSPAIAYLERHFMRDGRHPEPPPAFVEPAPQDGLRDCHVGTDRPAGVRFLLASGRRAEAELAAQQVAGLLRQGFSPGEIAVVVRKVQTWSSLLAHVFASCDIPHRVDDRRVLAETGLGYAFLAALEGVLLDDAKQVLSFVRGPYSGITPEAAADLELRYLKASRKGTRVLTAIAESMGVVGLQPLGTLVEIVGTGAEGGEVETAIPRLNPVAALAFAREMLEAGLRGAVVGGLEAEEDARSFRSLENALTTMTSVAGDGNGLLDPREALHALAEVDLAGSRSEAAGVVQVLSVQRARARRFEAVVVLGLVEGEFPGRPDQVSLLNPAQRGRLDAIGGGLFAPELDQEAALFVSAVSRASRVLFLSARDAEDDGGEATPSYFWEASKQLLHVGSEAHLVRTLADQVFAPQTAPSLRHYLRSCAMNGLNPHAAVVPGPSPPVPSWVRIPSRLTAPEVLAELAALECFSPSSLERYASCPFQWFVDRVVGVGEMEPELDGRVIGTLLHDALRDTYAELSAAGLLPLQPGGVQEAERTAAALIDELVQSDRCPGTEADRRLANWRLKRMASNLFDMEVSTGGALVPAEMELWVGGQDGVDLDGFRLSGRIDRADAAQERDALFVVDYKTGKVPAFSAFGTRDGLQLPLYLLALAAERPHTAILGGAYLGLSTKKCSGVVTAGSEDIVGLPRDGYHVLDDAGLEAVLAGARQTALAAVEGIRTGLIGPQSAHDCPSWCALGPVCRSFKGGNRP